MNPDDVREIMKLMEGSPFDELVLETKGFKLVLRKNGAAEERSESRSEPVLAPPPKAAAAPRNPAKPAKKAAAALPDGCVDVTAAFLGVFYAAPKPGADPFVKVGDHVEENTVIGIIEVMKLMNSAHAGVKGEVIEIFAENGAPVEYGQPLLRVRTIP